MVIDICWLYVLQLATDTDDHMYEKYIGCNVVVVHRNIFTRGDFYKTSVHYQRDLKAWIPPIDWQFLYVASQ